MTIKKNAIQCRYCGQELESTHRHDFVSHYCYNAGRIAKTYDHDKKSYEPDYPFIAADGGRDYLKRVGDKQHWIEASEWYDDTVDRDDTV